MPGRSDAAKEPAGGAASDPAENHAKDREEGTESEAAELRRVAEAIAREFPLVSQRSGLVLYDVDPDHLQAQWQVTQDDLNRARSSFPRGSGAAGLLLRLWRIDPDGSTREIASLRRNAGAAALQGQAVFGVQGGDAAYQGELGLASADGGWLLLVRSNRVRPPRPPRTPVPPGEEPKAGAQDGAEPRGGVPSARAEAGHGQVALAPQVVGHPSAESDQGEIATPAAAGEPVGRVEPALSRPESVLEPVFPLPARIGGAASTDSHGSRAVRAGGGSARPGGGEAAQEPARGMAPDTGGAPGGWAELPPPLLPSTPVGGGDQWSAAAGFYDPRGALSSPELARPGPGAPAVELHAEIRVWGHAAPGSLIDVFGLRIEVGPDGRFFLSRPVDDPQLLTRALNGPAGPPSETDTE